MLLAVMIMADGRVRDEEIDAFARGIEILQTNFEPGETMPTAAYRAWYDLNEARARDLSLAEPFDAAIMPYLSDLSDLDNRQLLLDQLGAIADADMHRDKHESDLLTLAAAFWGLVRTTAAA